MHNGGKGQGRNPDTKRPKRSGGPSARSGPAQRAGQKQNASTSDNASEKRPDRRPNKKTGHGPNQAATERSTKLRAVAAKAKTAPTGSQAPQAIMRIAKAMAAGGLCSRRDAERWIADGRVVVNGQTITSPALNVGPTDKVLVDGKALPTAQAVRLWRFHKPRGLITTHSDPQGRETVFDTLPNDMPRVISIGRLDYNTEGLLLMTTSGELARHIELPSTGWQRRYRVRGYGRVEQEDLDALKEGTVLDGIRYGPIEATVDTVQSGNCWLTIGLREGKNREVRKVLESLGLKVNRLIRLSFGPFELLKLPVGQLEEVPSKAISSHFSKDDAQRLNLNAEPPETPRPSRPTRARRPRRGDGA